MKKIQEASWTWKASHGAEDSFEFNALDSTKIELAHQKNHQGALVFGGMSVDLQAQTMHYVNAPDKVYQLARSKDNSRARTQASAKADASSLVRSNAQKSQGFKALAGAF